MKAFGLALALALTGIALIGAGSPVVQAYHWNIPAWAAPPIVPSDNPMSESKVLLGRYLFYDNDLSYNRTYSCATCHQQRLGFADPNVTAIGSTGEHHPRRASTLTNVGYETVLTWANPLQRKLEQQMLVPMFGERPIELGMGGHDKLLIERLTATPRYARLFAEAFPGDATPVTLGNVTKAIAAFERTLISFSSPYDRYRYGGDEHAISDSAKRGETLFFSERLQCFHCHGGVNFTDDSADTRTRLVPVSFHNTGLYNIHGTGDYPPNNTGVFDVTHDPDDMGKFKAPTLRNVAVRAPYMHDGSVATLDAALDHYRAGGRTIASGPYAGNGSLNRHKDPLIAGFTLTAQERRDLIAFLNSLTDQHFLRDPAFAKP
jgi:cytochrome c peroxidase